MYRSWILCLEKLHTTSLRSIGAISIYDVTLIMQILSLSNLDKNN